MGSSGSPPLSRSWSSCSWSSSLESNARKVGDRRDDVVDWFAGLFHKTPDPRLGDALAVFRSSVVEAASGATSTAVDGVMSLPRGFTSRGATKDDVEAVTMLVREVERIDAGEPSLTIEDLQSEWDLPGFNIQSDVVLVFDGEHLVAEAEVPGWRAEANVHPDARDRGVGTALLAWVEHRALEREPESARVRVGQTVISTNTDAISLFLDHGYGLRHTSWVLRLPDGVTMDNQPLPDGFEIRPFDPASEEHAVYQVIEDAFNEWPTRVPSTFAEWQSGVTGRSDFDPSLLLVATYLGDVVGVAFGISYEDEGWVQQLAVSAHYRGRGIAKALLRALFEEFRGRVFPAVGLSTDSRTGALDLYLGLGMVVRDMYVHYSKVLER